MWLGEGGLRAPVTIDRGPCYKIGVTELRVITAFCECKIKTEDDYGISIVEIARLVIGNRHCLGSRDSTKDQRSGKNLVNLEARNAR